MAKFGFQIVADSQDYATLPRGDLPAKGIRRLRIEWAVIESHQLNAANAPSRAVFLPVYDILAAQAPIAAAPGATVSKVVQADVAAYHFLAAHQSGYAPVIGLGQFLEQRGLPGQLFITWVLHG
jgi:hypothetical protein